MKKELNGVTLSWEDHGSGETAVVARETILANPPRGIAAALRGMAERGDSTEVLGGIRVPTLVVVGEEDEPTPPPLSRQMAAAIPKAKLQVIPDAGHLTNRERPEAFTAALDSFLSELT